MHRQVSSLPLAPSVKVKLVSAGFQFTADLLHCQPLQLSTGTCSVLRFSPLYTAQVDPV